MKYEIKIPAILGDVIPLYFVADAMAGAASTAFGKTPRHKPIYDCDLRTHIKHLLDQVHSGKLVVCNRAGNIDTAANIIAVAKMTGDYSEKSRFVRELDWAELKRLHPPAKEGVLDLSGVDLGPSITDWDVTNIECLYSKLHCLNEWGKPRGDEFSIAAESAAWVDERGYMNPTDERAPPVEVEPTAKKAGTNKKKWDDAKLEVLWKESILPGVTQASLANKHGVKHQRISTLLAKAKDVHNGRKVSPYSVAGQLYQANKSSRPKGRGINQKKLK